ncbi:mandelate racemase/muconate lactonizing enzyme family protein [Microbacterium sp. W4I20]|uniref:mandelate racemase/muconate lactonizing enzyme family protein n=1 Tax=Microbacterium sp. W4I20 TaxID=3042262 RepID=UPI002787AB17|nr:mandelate racemase/muconate lactonizing enzyme family protein [Microbacterium sp. W4I20]MDQ0726728.1 L-alanine-DL-glutamate epimerase-like enolase superfamily enzyme [Microbacterium sp. W4I20]
MHIDAVDFFYLAMPEVLDVGDGSQDVLLVRVEAGGYEGWGECEASPLTSIASLIAPMSHSACHPVLSSILGEKLESAEDIDAISRRTRARSFDLLQTAHTLSGIDIAMWDLLGRRFEEPVWKLLGQERSMGKRPYASVLFGDTPEETRLRGARAVESGFRAVKFGWQGFGTQSLRDDVDQLAAAREGVGEAELMIDAAMAWGSDPAPAIERAAALEEFHVLFLEEPFIPGADRAYRTLRGALTNVKIAAGEGSHSEEMALNMLDSANVDYLQIDAGRIGGITTASRVARATANRGATYLNHTFTSHLALSASLQPYVGDATSTWCEYPLDSQPVSRDLTVETLAVDADGLVRVPDSPGLGLTINKEVVGRYAVNVEITIDGDSVFRSPFIEPAVRLA